MTNNPSLDLVEFVETQILPQYAAFDKAHNMEHVTRVIRRSLDLARKTGADLDMAYAIAAYHDLGLSGPRAIHHLTSGKILLADARLKRWFSADKLVMMKEAVEDHRASASRAPRSIYGKIVANTWTRNTPSMVTYACGYRVQRTSANSTNCACSLQNQTRCVPFSTGFSKKRPIRNNDIS